MNAPIILPSEVQVMRMPRVRFTVRRMMVAVAIAGVVTGIAVLKKKRDGFLERARFHAMVEQSGLEIAESFFAVAGAFREFADGAMPADSLPRLVVHPTSRPDDEYVFIPQHDPPAETDSGQLEQDGSGIAAIAFRNRENAAWHGALKRKYERAARYPWLPVAPDPPEPE
jgi:hypothetical protein